MKLVVLGLSLTSSWGNGHATTYRGLLREFARRGHDIVFVERDLPWYADNRDQPSCSYARIALYESVEELKANHASLIREADAVIVGSYVPEGIAVGDWVLNTASGITAFYDIDTPVTLKKITDGSCDYLSPELIPRYDVYLSFSGGPTLQRLEREFGSPLARPLYCSVDPALYFSEPRSPSWDLGYLGTYSSDRQPGLERLLLTPAAALPDARFVVAGPQYPPEVHWPANVSRIEHLSPSLHRDFYNRQRFTLNLTRAAMTVAGYSPSVRLFEAAACGTPIITDSWPGLEDFFTPGRDILVGRSSNELLALLTTSAAAARAIGESARARVLAHHTAAHRAAELEQHLHDARCVAESAA
jgi:spore maturation protein CgeB